MPLILQTTTLAGEDAQDLRTVKALATYTAVADCVVAPQVRLSSLANSATTYTVSLVLLSAADAVIGALTHAAVKPVATDTVWLSRLLGPVALASGEKLRVDCLSSNAGDTAVEAVTQFVDAAFASNMVSVAGLATQSDVTGAQAAVIAAIPEPADIAAVILATPANKLATGADGSVVASNAGEVDLSGLATSQDVTDAQAAIIAALPDAPDNASIAKIRAAVYDTATADGDDVTLSNGAVQTVTATGRATVEP